MRIRKRQVPFPFSSLSPVPISDPPLLNLNRPPPVVQLPFQSQPLNPPENPSIDGSKLSHVHPQPSDRPNQRLSPIGKGIHGWDFSGKEKKKEEDPQENLFQEKNHRGGEEEEEEGEKGNDSRKGSILGAETVSGILQESSTSSQASGRWCEGEKAIPLKKRRASLDQQMTIMADLEKDKKMKTKMKTKMNKKCPRDDVEEEEEARVGQQLQQLGSTVKNNKKARGGALMEGSRCSRVNGRGWRCCQQTLVGYSLCEHHLGKGRLRSMTSFRSRPPMSKSSVELPLLSSSSSSMAEEEAKVKLPLEIAKNSTKKKKTKLGMVKARSMSSLLGQTNSATSGN
ncbi:hypothetical protein UlMin_005138 [Ulmus minor]